ncbi:MAG: response regulator [Candidatus Omnitrophota bacterium]
MAKKVLIIDDNEVTCSLLIERIKFAGYNVFSANDGKKGLELIHKELPDLVFLDVRMPGMDGFEVCRLAKSDPLIKNIPIVFLTTAGQQKDIDRGKELGSSGYIVKPYDGIELLKEIKKLVGE